MWSAIIGGVVTLVKQWFDTKKAKQESEAEYYRNALKGEQDWDLEAMRQARYSWKDEMIAIIWYAPLVVAWFDPDRALEWVIFVDKLPTWYQMGMFGIMAASFGLRWFFKRQAFEIPKRVSSEHKQP